MKTTCGCSWRPFLKPKQHTQAAQLRRIPPPEPAPMAIIIIESLEPDSLSVSLRRSDGI